MKIFCRSSIVFLCLFLSLASWGVTTPYLSAKEFHTVNLLAPPSETGSAEQKTDLQEVQNWQTRRRPEDCARADRVPHVTLATGFGGPDGTLSAEELKRLDPFFDRIRENAEIFIKEGKNHWKRLRPFAAYKAILPCAPRDEKKTSFSYPSGHATLAELYAKILGEIHPEQKEIFLKRADQIAADRVLSGVHYPSDIRAGKKLADELFQQFMNSPAFREELRQLQKK